MSDWWSDRLAGKAVAPKAPAREGSTPTLRFTPPGVLGVPLTTQPTPQAQYMAQAAAVNTEQRSDPTGQTTIGEAIRNWQGGEAARKEGNNTCPECGSGNVFSRMAKGAGAGINGNAPAPRCYECGWNGIYNQGSEANWIA